mmetsp:Transcript_43064/g.111665  ORF Transcript_43064/g.111665 Transcript_43064/m.111665 type:complete len:295 (-) Transcript_43064:974-1858(-)
MRLGTRVVDSSSRPICRSCSLSRSFCVVAHIAQLTASRALFLASTRSCSASSRASNAFSRSVSAISVCRSASFCASLARCSELNARTAITPAATPPARMSPTTSTASSLASRRARAACLLDARAYCSCSLVGTGRMPALRPILHQSPHLSLSPRLSSRLLGWSCIIHCSARCCSHECSFAYSRSFSTNLRRLWCTVEWPRLAKSSSRQAQKLMEDSVLNRLVTALSVSGLPGVSSTPSKLCSAEPLAGSVCQALVGPPIMVSRSHAPWSSMTTTSGLLYFTAYASSCRQLNDSR